ncbi:MAG: glycerate dehydrogenase [Proteobacteria bacterium]|nr:glycerate dehydrogenase [Pseudomonadota bacterium]
MRAVFLDYGSVAVAGDLDPTRLLAALPGLKIHEASSDAEVDERIAGAEVVVCNRSLLGRARLEAQSALRLVALTATGTNNVDLEAARERGIAVCNIADYCTASVAQHVFAVLLALTHRLREYDRALKAGAWERGGEAPAWPVRELAGRTLGIVGYGTLGRAVERLARAFGMDVQVAARPGEAPAPGRVALEALLPRVDVLTLHCPITPATRGLIGAPALALMKADAVLINTARGGLVDAAALAAALRAGRLGGAAVDVLEEEPPAHGSPLLAPDLVNLIVTPHTAWAAREARQRAIDEVAANVTAFYRGERRHRVI